LPACAALDIARQFGAGRLTSPFKPMMNRQAWIGNEYGMTSGSSPRWQWIIVALLALCVIGYIWTLQ
jgi:hypothetical protein